MPKSDQSGHLISYQRKRGVFVFLGTILFVGVLFVSGNIKMTHAADSYTKLLLHGDGTNGSTTFADSSSSPKTVTPVGDAKISTTQNKFGGASMNFDGTGDYLYSPDSEDWNFGNGDFTIDYFVRHINLTSSWHNQQRHVNQWGALGNYGWQIGTNNGDGTINFYYSTSGSNYTGVISPAGAIVANVWNHVAVVRSGSTITMYVNGTAVASGSVSGSIFNSTVELRIGHDNDTVNNPTAFLNGYIDELRISKGVARWTSNFTAPIREYDDTVLLLHGDGANSSTTFTDSAPAPKTVTVSGDAKISTAQSKFGGSSMSFDGTGDYLSLPESADWNFGSSAFTIDSWVRVNSFTSFAYGKYAPIVSAGTDYMIGGWGLVLSSPNNQESDTRIYMGINSSVDDWAQSKTSAAVSNFHFGAWNHVAIVGDGSNLRFFFNGDLVSTFSYTSMPVPLNRGLRVGSFFYRDSFNPNLNGYIDELRISKGIARWTSSFTPPALAYYDTTPVYSLTYTAGFNGSITGTASQSVAQNGNGTAVTAVPSAGYTFVSWNDGSTQNPRMDINVQANLSVTATFQQGDTDTKLLLHGDSYNNSTTFLDSAPSPKTVTVNGDAKISNVQNKFGGSSMYFDGNGDNITTPDSVDYTFGTGDYTVDAWFKTSSINGLLAGQMPTNGAQETYNFMLLIDANGKAYFTPDYASYPSHHNITSTNALNDNNWHHIAVVRNGAYFKMYVDGTETGTTLNMGTGFSMNDSNQTMKVGGMGGAENYIPFSGYIDELRISKGIARWTSNFTPPTSAYTGISSYTLTYTSGDNGTLSGTSPQTVAQGSDGTTITANPNEGYHFVDWNDASTSNPRTDTNVQANLSVTANFALNDQTIDNPTPQKINDAYALGAFTLTDGTTSDTSKATTTTAVTLQSNNASLVIPTNTEITKTTSGNINLTNLTTTDITETIQATLGSSKAAIRIGIPNVPITFSKDVTINLPIPQAYNNETLTIYSRPDGGTTWTHETTCLVSSSTCSFTTRHATEYTANYEVSNSPTPTDVNVDINATLTMECKDANTNTEDFINLNPITGTGQSTPNANNDVKCIIVTNNSSGYTLSFTSSTPELINQNNDTISSDTPGTTNTPETWNVSTANSEWGARLLSSSSTYNPTTWGAIGTDNYSAKWYSVTNTNSFILANRATETAQTGDDQIIRFGAEVGQSKFQPTGTYDTDVTFTAVTN